MRFIFSLKARLQLLIIAGLSSLIYLFVYTLPFPLTTFYTTIPPVDYAKLTDHSVTGLGAYLLGLTGLFALYLAALRLTRPQADQPPPLKPGLVFGPSLLYSLILLGAYPITAIDLFIYAIRTRGWALYGLNPLATPPKALPAADPWLGLAGEWIDAASPYGPLWEGLSLAAFQLSGGQFLAHLLALKLLAALAYLGCVWLVYRLLQRLRPAWQLAGTLAFAWNPLVLMESVQNGHNDIVMTFFLLVAVWGLVERQSGAANRAWLGWLLLCLGLALSILVKFVTIIVAPLLLLGSARQRTGRLRHLLEIGLAGLLIAGMVGAAMAPLWPGWEAWAVPQAANQAGRSLLAVLVLSLRGWLGTNLAFDSARTGLLLLFGLIYLAGLAHLLGRGPRWSGYLFGQSPSESKGCALERTLLVVCLSLFWYVLLAAPVFHAWYLLWFLPLVPLLPWGRTQRAAIVFSITALVVIPYFETIRVWYPFLLQNHLVGHLLGVSLLILPPLWSLLAPISPTAPSEVLSSAGAE